MGRPFVIGQGGQALWTGDDDDEVVGVHGPDAGRRLERAGPVEGCPGDGGQLHRLALVEGVEEPSRDRHRALQPPFVGQAVEAHGTRGAIARVAGLVARRRGRWGLLLPAQPERHPYSSALPVFSRIVSTTVASASVVVSPSVRPSAMSRRSRRMILPERVLGRSGTNIRNFGRAIGPMT